MESKDYEIILDALNKIEENEEVKKLKRKIELFLESDKIREEYQANMEKISKEIQELVTNK